MKKDLFFLLTIWIYFSSGVLAKNTETHSNVSPEEMAACQQWTDKEFAQSDALPFSFTYEGISSDKFLAKCKMQFQSKGLSNDRKQEVRIYTDPVSGLEVRCEMVRYADYPAVEWVVYLKNTGKSRTGIIENLQALNVPFDLGGHDDLYLNYNEGGNSGPKDFKPNRVKIDPQTPQKFGAFWGGFPTAETLPFFNAEWNSGKQGVISAVGWPAQWQSTFDRSVNTAMTVKVGQIKTRLYLNPGEEIRTPLVVLMFWQGSHDEAQNMWRRWMFDYNLPRPGGKLPEPILEAASSAYFAEMFHATDKDEIEFIDRFLEEGIKLDYWWMDAGWYPNKGGSWQDFLGTWVPDKKRYPNGLRAISDHAHSKGEKTILWFEPERVTEGSWIYNNHPEWTLGSGSTRFFNYGNPEALAWMTNHVDSVLTSETIDLYRQDFAVFSSSYWNEEDQKYPDRQGIAEIKHVVGYLKYLDELRKRHPDMLIDICDAGGKRLEMENLRRAVPLWRSDYAFEPIGVQGQTYGLSSWIPFSGAGVNSINTYDFLSNMSPSTVLNLDVRNKTADYPLLRRLLAQWKEVRDDYRGDYYPLTPYSLEKNVWIGWEFFCPEKGTGFIQIFNRPESICDSDLCRLKGLNREKQYRIIDLETNESRRYDGARLLDEGLRFTFKKAPEAKLLRVVEVK
ncbi:MAG: alpha-galactosidase [Bacteroidota bacterium]|nr:alpha-galactosidase [Bacteroidota bacterium]